MEIIKGKVWQPIKAVVYGCEGIGKSTFASKWPQPLIVDFEGGSFQLDVDRVCPKALAEFGGILAELKKDCNYKTLVIDTADWMEKVLTAAVLAKTGKPSIESFDWGKGWTMVAEEWKRMLDMLDSLRKAQAVNILFLAHACIRHLDQPDSTGFDRFEMKCSKQGNSLLKEWADMILFARYKTITVEEKNKTRATGEKRVMQTQHAACWDAKNRHDLKAELPFEFDSIAQIFKDAMKKEAPTAVAESSAKQTEPKTDMPKSEPTRELPKTVSVTDSEKEEVLAQVVAACKASGLTPHDLMQEVARKGIATEDMKPSQLPVHTLKRILGNWDTIKSNILKTKGL